MSNIHIVTDSCARFVNAQVMQQYPVTIVPNKITIDGKSYREGIDISAEDALHLIANRPAELTVTSPTVAEYTEVYNRLSRSHDAIISIHASRELYPSWQNARNAVQQLAGHCEIAVVDSRTICAAQAMLVRVASKAIQKQEPLDNIVRTVRGAIDRLYSVYYVETLDYLYKNKIMTASHAILGTYLNIRPFLVVEEGHLVVVEKVRTRTQAVDQLVEFIMEFTDIEDIAILQQKAHLTEQTRLLQDRLMLEYPGQYFPYMPYNPSLAALIGADATGIVVLECELDDLDNGY